MVDIIQDNFFLFIITGSDDRSFWQQKKIIMSYYQDQMINIPHVNWDWIFGLLKYEHVAHGICQVAYLVLVSPHSRHASLLLGKKSELCVQYSALYDIPHAKYKPHNEQCPSETALWMAAVTICDEFVSVKMTLPEMYMD